MREGTQIPAHREYHIAAPAPIAPGGPAFGDIFFPAERHTAITAGTGRHFDQRLIGKFFQFSKLTSQFQNPAPWPGLFKAGMNPSRVCGTAGLIPRQ
jgi:hypothetical protein